MYLPFKKDLSNLGILSALGLYLANKPKLAAYVGGASLALRFLPVSNYSFSNKSVVITGGSRGLGLILAKELLAHGATVTILARDRLELERAQNWLQMDTSDRVLALVCDVTDEGEIKNSFHKVIQRFGTIDILINNAGSVSVGPFESMNLEDFEAQMKLHFFAPLKTVQQVLPYFKFQKSGKIVNISSIGGKVPVPHMSPYCASKFAISGFSQALSAELAKDNIQVTTVYPGLMRTGSPIQAVFKGDAKKEFAWFAMSDSTPGLAISAQRAAQQILKSVQAGETELVITVPAKIGTFVYTNFPQLFTSVMKLVNRFLPQDFTNERKTGAQVRGWLDQKFWAKPFLSILGRAQRKHNEFEKYDADFNLNV